MPSKQKGPFVIRDQLNDELIHMLRTHLNIMDNPYDNKSLSSQIFSRIQEAKKESMKIIHESDLHDITHTLRQNQFVDKLICEYTVKNLHYQYDVTFQYKNIDFYIYIMFEEKINLDEYVNMIKLIICLCLHDIQNEKKDKMILNLYLTPFEKNIPINFPNKVIPIHVNSGFTNFEHCMNVCIFRKEEWVKVFIHECFHAFNMDFHEEKINFCNLFSSTFFVQSEFLIFESLVEFWARILNCAIFTYFLKPKITRDEFHMIFTLNMNMDRIFSIMQGSKLLKVFQLEYGNIIDKKQGTASKKIYKEETNAFCYYIITSILMNSFDKTLNWFDVNNTRLFSFDKSERQVIIFSHYIKQLAKDSQLVKLYETVKPPQIQEKNSMKMTLFDIQIE
tara:strand:+ start:1436 stop:2611 length:1176 start_codon:yes stop_codon:yes gene_type:complete